MFDVVSKVATDIVTSGISKLVLGDSEKSSESATENSETQSTESSDFDSIIRKFLPSSDSAEISEEELFAAAVGQRIYALKGDEGLAKYQEFLEANKISLTTPSGHVQVEEAAIQSLKQMVADGLITSEEGDSVYSDSFAAAQLDSNSTALFDGKGDANDPTRAVALMSEAMMKIKTYLDADESTRSNQALLSLESASQTGSAVTAAATSSSGITVNSGTVSGDGSTVNPNGTYVDGSEGFLFKPVTNNQGALAVMFAQSWTNNIAAVRLLDQNGNLVEEGTRMPYGIAETGREKFTFSKEGSAYPSNINVEVKFKDGSLKMFNIPDPSMRYD